MAIKQFTKNGKKLFEVYVNGLDQNGRRFQKRKRNIESIRKAQDIEFEFQRQLANLRDSPKSYNWDEWSELALARMRLELMASSVMNYSSYLSKWVTPHWKDKELKSITREDVYSIVFDKFDAKFSPHSRRTLLKYLKRVCQRAIDERALDRNPGSGIKVQVPETDLKVLSNEEAKLFLREATLSHHPFYPIWAMALMTGMRSGELYALNWSDVDLDARLISVSKQWTSKTGITDTKTRKSRLVPISDELSLFLKELKLKSKTEHVLPQPLEWQNGEQALITRRFCEGIGVTSVKFHDLRATFITNLLARGESLGRVMTIVGHTQLKTTNGYFRKAGVDIQGGTDKLRYGLPSEVTATVLQLKV